jgi:hypothetical protein
MSWQTTTSRNWQAVVHAQAKALAHPQMAAMITGFQLVPAFAAHEDVPAAIHEGPLEVSGDFTPEALITVVLGDLTVGGQVSTQEAAGFDGNATLIVFGNLRCASLVNDWASIVMVTGDLEASSFVFTAREDSALVIGGDFTTPVFVGADIWANVGGTARMETGHGYALPLGLADVDVSKVTEPASDWRAMAAQLQIADVSSEFAVEEALEDRLRRTGTLMP